MGTRVDVLINQRRWVPPAFRPVRTSRPQHPPTTTRPFLSRRRRRGPFSPSEDTTSDVMMDTFQGPTLRAPCSFARRSSRRASSALLKAPRARAPPLLRTSRPRWAASTTTGRAWPLRLPRQQVCPEHRHQIPLHRPQGPGNRHHPAPPGLGDDGGCNFPHPQTILLPSSPLTPRVSCFLSPSTALRDRT